MAWMILWLAFCGLCFALGMVWAWRRARRRMQARVDQVVAEEMRRQLAGSVMRDVERARANQGGGNGHADS